MARLTDADALLKSEIRRCGRIPTIGTGYINEKNFESILAESPTVDSVEVVRCKDCKRSNRSMETGGLTMVEKWLIDANALVDIVNISKHDNPHKDSRLRANHINEHNHFLRLISESKTVNAVEVVRCRDCKYRKEPENRLCNPYCTKHLSMQAKDDDFCSCGERKTDG